MARASGKPVVVSLVLASVLVAALPAASRTSERQTKPREQVLVYKGPLPAPIYFHFYKRPETFSEPHPLNPLPKGSVVRFFIVAESRGTIFLETTDGYRSGPTAWAQATEQRYFDRVQTAALEDMVIHRAALERTEQEALAAKRAAEAKRAQELREAAERQRLAVEQERRQRELAGSQSHAFAVVKSFYETANAGKYSELARLASKDLLSSVSSALGAASGGWKGLADQLTRDGTLTRLEYLREEVRGEGARVYFVKHFRDGTTTQDSQPLVYESSRWKIAVR